MQEQKLQQAIENRRHLEIAAKERAAFAEEEKQRLVEEKRKQDLRLQYGLELKDQIKFVDYLKVS